MPFVSDAQKGYMYANKPKLAAEMQSKTPARVDLPSKVAPQAVNAKPMATSMAKPAAAPMTPDRKKMAMQNMVSKYGKGM